MVVPGVVLEACVEVPAGFVGGPPFPVVPVPAVEVVLGGLVVVVGGFDPLVVLVPVVVGLGVVCGGVVGVGGFGGVVLFGGGGGEGGFVEVEPGALS